jgi:hypothetical protein
MITDGGRGETKEPSVGYALNTSGIKELKSTYKTLLSQPSRTRSETVEEEKDGKKEPTLKKATHDHNTRARARAEERATQWE